MQDRQQLLHQEERCADVDGEQPVKIGNRRLLDQGGLADAGIGHKNVEPVADDLLHLRRQLVRPL